MEIKKAAWIEQLFLSLYCQVLFLVFMSVLVAPETVDFTYVACCDESVDFVIVDEFHQVFF